MGKIGKLKALEQRVRELEVKQLEDEAENDPIQKLFNQSLSVLDWIDVCTFALPDQETRGNKKRGERIGAIMEEAAEEEWLPRKLTFIIGLKTINFELPLGGDAFEQASRGYGSLRTWLNTASGDAELEAMRLDWAKQQLSGVPENEQNDILLKLALIPKPAIDPSAGQLLPLSEPPSSPVKKRSEAVEVQPTRVPSLVPSPRPTPKGNNVVQVRYIGNRAQNSFQLLTTTGMQNVSRGQIYMVNQELFAHSLAGDREWQRV